MPELPEVETIRRDLEDKVLNQKFVGIAVHDGRVIRGVSEKAFIRDCRGQKILAVSRRGKAIIMQLVGGYLIVQPMMTGQLIFFSDRKAGQAHKHTKVTFTLSNGGCLNYNDQRLFGRLTFVKDLKALKFLQTIGPEPFDEAFDPPFIARAVKTRQAPIKSVLMNQQIVAGIGNIYASEILFACGIDPRKPAKRLKAQDIERLHQATVSILKEAVRYRGTSMRDYRDASGQKGNFIDRIRIYGRENEACFVCRKPVTRIVQAGRSTFYCKKCQK